MSQTSSPEASSSSEPDIAAAEPTKAGRNEWLLVFFTAATNLADAITKVALPLLAHHLTHSPGLISLVGVLITLPWLVTALHIGVLVDRLNRRTLMVIAETIRLLSVLTMVTTIAAHVVSLPLVYVMAVVLGVAEVVALTSGASIVPAAVPRSRWPQASARITAMEYLFNAFIGAPIGGFLVAIGFVFAFGSTAFVYAAGMVLLSLLAGNFRPQREPGTSAERRPVHVEIRDGLKVLWQHRILRTMALLIAVLAGTWSAWLALLPAYAPAPGPLGLTSREYGLLLTCMGVGGVIGTMVVGPINRVLGRRWSMFVDIIGSFVLVAAPAVLPAARSSAFIIGAVALIAGIGGTMWTVNSRVIIQTLVPSDMLGRFNAAYRLVSWGMAPIAAAIGGLLAQFVSYHVAFGFFAVICLLMIVPYLRVVTASALAEIDAPPPPPGADTSAGTEPA